MIPQSYQKVALVLDTFFQWCNDAAHICSDICAGKVIFWKVRNFFLPVPLTASMPVNYVLRLATRQRPNKVGVMIGMDSHAWEKQVLFIGSQWCAHGCRGSRLVEGRHHRSERKLLMPGMFVGTDGRGGGRGGWSGGGRHRGENRPPGSRASKAGLTESIWTTVNRRQPVCWLPLSCIFTGSFPTNTRRSARLSKRSLSLGFSTKLRRTILLCPSIQGSRLKSSKSQRIVKNHN